MDSDPHESGTRCYAPTNTQDKGSSDSDRPYAGSGSSQRIDEILVGVDNKSPKAEMPDEIPINTEATMSGTVGSIHDIVRVRDDMLTTTERSQDLAGSISHEEMPSRTTGQTIKLGEGVAETDTGMNNLFKKKGQAEETYAATPAGADFVHLPGEASGSSAHNNIPSQNDVASEDTENRRYGKLISEEELLDNSGITAGRDMSSINAGGVTAIHPTATSPLRQPENIDDQSSYFTEPMETSEIPIARPGRDFSEIILPRWQPDAEVTYCPICRTQFSFFVRKHHCRKCGRVVCNACSPHRITIPYQYIVQPPPAIQASTSSSISQRQSIIHILEPGTDYTDRNGGMKVRLCNPCVPDPNPLPPQPPPYSFETGAANDGNTGRARGMSAASGLRVSSPNMFMRNATASTNANLPLRIHRVSRYADHVRRSDSVRIQGLGHTSTASSLYSSSPAHTSQSHGHFSRHQSISSTTGISTSNPQPHYRSLLDVGTEPYTQTPSSNNRPLPPIPRVLEDDECPVCHRVLLSRGMPDFENRRAAHIIQCIDEQIALHSGSATRPGAYTSQSQPGTTSTTPSSSTAQQGAPRDLSPLRPQSVLPAPIANTPEARTAAREQAHAAVVLGASSSATSDNLTRRTGMFQYKASEKDCVDDAECTICLEEFEVGAAMARLECFCRFHKSCIQEWFVDHPGRCPVHQHDGYGF